MKSTPNGCMHSVNGRVGKFIRFIWRGKRREWLGTKRMHFLFFSFSLSLSLSPILSLKIDFGFFVWTFVLACGCTRVLTAKIKSERLCMYKSHFFLLLIHLLQVNPQDRQQVTGFEILTESHKRPRAKMHQKPRAQKERKRAKSEEAKSEGWNRLQLNQRQKSDALHQLQDTKSWADAVELQLVPVAKIAHLD